jgi:NAD(P)-dependent dehydrogenase (short-subunit alcohol dehydrogenase family)
MSLFDLSGRVAIVTGGNGGIGLGMAEGLASARCHSYSSRAPARHFSGAFPAQADR